MSIDRRDKAQPMQSEDPQGANGSCVYAKRAAMFGLDARIALAIFGALTIIAGASLISVFDKLAVNRGVAKINEIEKALAAYLVDTGNNARFHGFHTANFWGNDLIIDDGLDGWSGPYLSSFDEWTYNHAYGMVRDSKLSAGRDKDSSDGAGRVLIRLIDNNYVAPNTYSPTSSTTSCTNGCHFWFIVELEQNPYNGGLTEAHFVNLMDEYYDNGDGYANGKFQWRSGSHITFRVKLMPKV